MLETWRRRRMLQRVPELVATTPDGAVARVTGTVRAARGVELIAPCSGRACVVYRVQVRVALQYQFQTVTWGDIVPFELVAPIGTVTVESKDVQLVLPHIERPVDGPRDPELAVRWRELLRAHDVPSRRISAILETTVAAGEVHTVAGVVQRVAPPPEEQIALRDSPPRLRLVGAPAQPLLIGNAP